MAEAPARVTDELIEMRGLRFHYRDWAPAKPGAPDLVLLHGFTGHARSWDAFAEAMSDRYRVLALDQRGHGESGWADPEFYGVEDMADDLVAFVAAMGLDGFTLLGLSLGGMVVMEYAGRRPKELAACVIVDVGPKIATEGGRRIQAGVRAGDVFASKDEAFAAARLANPVPSDDDLRRRSDAGLMRMADGRWTYRYDRAFRTRPVLRPRAPEVAWTSCANIAVPTQLIRGELSDILTPEMAETMMTTIPDARFSEVEGSGHTVPLDRPDDFLAAAREFLRG